MGRQAMFASINLLIFGSMKTKRTVFEVNDVYRVMENSELIYTLTNSEKLKREEYKYEQMEIEGLCLSDVLETLTPSRKKVAYAAIELYKRLKEGQVESPALLSSNNVYKMMHPVLCDIATEEMWVLLLNSSSKLIRKVRISCGGINTAPVDIRVIMKQALYYNAVSFIMVHNHPSGARKPSSADDRLTEAVKKAAETLDIRLVDHVIVAGNNYYSYADEGRLQNIYDWVKTTPALEGMGTTAVVAYVTGSDLYWANVGDSRLYVFHEDRLTQISTDHSMVQALYEAGELKADDMLQHPQRNVLTRAVGVGPVVDIDAGVYKVMPGDRILLCSDGLTGYIEQAVIEEAFRKEAKDERLIEDLMTLVYDQGARDNVTIVIGTID